MWKLFTLEIRFLIFECSNTKILEKNFQEDGFPQHKGKYFLGFLGINGFSYITALNERCDQLQFSIKIQLNRI